MPVEIRKSSQDEVARFRNGKDTSPILISDLSDEATEVLKQICLSENLMATMKFSGPLAHIRANQISPRVAYQLTRIGLSVLTTIREGEEDSVVVIIGINLPSKD